MQYTILAVIAAYMGALLAVSWITGRGKKPGEGFFTAGRATPWYIVAAGMLGDSISGVTFVSVPGMARDLDMTYMQLVAGFFIGYIIVASVLLPLYYRLRLVSIYTYLKTRFGPCTYRCGASFFLLSKTVGAAAKLYLVAMILSQLVFAPLGVPLWLTSCSLVAVIWLYTSRGGMRAIVWTDVLQTACLLTALAVITAQVASRLGLDAAGVVETVARSPHSRMIVWDDWLSPNHLVKQLVSGALIVVAMTGLDQNMMQKNLTCRSLADARKNMLAYGFGFIPMNLLFLTLGVLLLEFASREGIALPAASDGILPMLASGWLGPVAAVCFAAGVAAAAFSNADSALTSLTTSLCVDILGIDASDPRRHWRALRLAHAAVCAAFAAVMVAIGGLRHTSVLDTIYTAVSYTYGPLLGLYAFGLMTRRAVRDRLTPWVCAASPLLTWLLAAALRRWAGYEAGYELLLVNGAACFLLLAAIQKRAPLPGH